MVFEYLLIQQYSLMMYYNILHNKLNVVKGTKTETYNGEKYFIVENGIISMQIDDDNNMNNQQSNNSGLMPGASGKITFVNSIFLIFVGISSFSGCRREKRQQSGCLCRVRFLT